MKVIVISLVVILVACTTAKKEKGRVIPVFNSAQKDLSATDTSHRAGDAEVFMIKEKDTIYYCRMYRNDGGELRRYETSITNGVYDRYDHSWINDSTVAFTLYNSVANARMSLQLMGSGASTSVHTGD